MIPSYSNNNYNNMNNSMTGGGRKGAAEFIIPGTVKALYENDKTHPGVNSPWFQVHSIRKLVSTGTTQQNGQTVAGVDRFRVLLSDGDFTIPAMFGSTYSKWITEGGIKPLSIIQIKSFAFSVITNKNKDMTLIMLPRDVDCSNIKDFDSVIGSPATYQGFIDFSSFASNNNENVQNRSNVNNAVTGNLVTGNVATGNVSMQQYQQPTQSHQQQNNFQSNSFQANNINNNINNNNNNASSAAFNSNYNGGSNYPLNNNNNYNGNNSNINTNYNSNSKSNNFNSMTTSSSNYNAGAGRSGDFQVDDSSVVPIASISPYNQKWLIKARVTNKSDMRTWSNAKGEGKLFSVTLVDASGEIKAAAFNDAADRFFNILHLNKVYYVSRAAVKIAKKQYSNVQNDYEITLDANSVIEPCLTDDGSSIPSIKYNFTPIQHITDLERDTTIDVIGVVKECGEVVEITSKTTQRTSKKRDIVLVDQTGTSINVTLWGNHAIGFSEASSNAPIVAIKGARVSEYQGRSLNLSSSSTFAINPDVPESHQLRGWYDQNGAQSNFMSLTTGSAAVGGAVGSGVPAYDRPEHRIVISQIMDEQLGHGEKPDYFNLIATISYIKSDGTLYYTACPSVNCNKKVTQISGGQWSCEKCSKTFSHCEYRYMMSIQVIDRSGTHYLNVFDEVGRIILGGKTAEELNRLRENQNDDYLKVFKDSVHKMYNFKVRAKQEMYQNEAKVRCSVISASPIDVEKETDLMIEYLHHNGYPA